MSLESWKAEFYPIEAAEVDGDNPVALVSHSLQKWNGKLPENLEKHDLIVSGFRSITHRRYPEAGKFEFDSTTCALCHFYYGSVVDEDTGSECCACPIVKAGFVGCEERDSAYLESTRAMVDVLEKTLIWVKSQK